MERPMCLIENSPNDKLQVKQEDPGILLMIQQPGVVAAIVVVLVGLFWTSKSFLMKKLTGKKKGFSWHLPLSIMEAPMCLIENNPNEKLQVNPEALEILRKIQQAVVVVAIVGTYRTGKSYLMNILAGKKKGFPLGATVQANTKGIWMWCLPHPIMPDHTLVLLDTEGLGDVEKSNTQNDAWIFALSILLSSTFVYNSMGTIDQVALEKLQYVTELTKRIKVKASPKKTSEDEEDECDFLRFFPVFIWAVRDFSLQLKLDGCCITEDEYLENALKRKPDSPETLDLAKKCIRQYFPSRKCFVFDRPAGTRDLEDLEDLPESKLIPDFLEQSNKFCQYIYKNAQPKMIQGGHRVTGKSLGHLVQTYVDAIASGTVPCIENAVTVLAQIENTAAVQDAITCYEAAIKQCVKLPTETVNEVLEAHGQCEKEALKVFMARAFKDDNHEYQKNLAIQFQSKLQELISQNEQVSLDRCQAVLMDLFQVVEEKISNGSYSVPGGYQMFLEDQKEKLENYELVPEKGLMAAKALQDFLKSKDMTVQSILKADQILTDKQKEIEVEKIRAEASTREAELHEKMKIEAKKRAEQEKRSFEEHKNQLLEKMDADRKQLLAEHEAVLNRKLEEQHRLQQEGFDQEVLKFHHEIQSLQSEMAQIRAEASGKEAQLQKEMQEQAQWMAQQKEQSLKQLIAMLEEEKKRHLLAEQVMRLNQKVQEQLQWLREEKMNQKILRREAELVLLIELNQAEKCVIS